MSECTCYFMEPTPDCLKHFPPPEPMWLVRLKWPYRRLRQWYVWKRYAVKPPPTRTSDW